MSDVFISYSRLDKDFVGKIYEGLLEKNQNVWVDWEDIPPSQSWWDEIQKGIAKANNIVLILSPNSMSSVVCHMEIEYARSLKKRIIPVLHAPYERDTCIAEMNKRLAKPEEFATREIWGTRLSQNMYDANDGDLKHINFFFFGTDADFTTKFASLFEIIHTDYAHKEEHTTLLLRATEWNKRGRDVSFLLLDTELDQTKIWLKASSGKQPPPTELQLAYIQASEKRTRQLHNIRRASIIGTLVAVVALIFAVGASLIGVQATQSANIASTREASANIQVANANDQLTAVPPTLTQVNKAVFSAQDAANIANTAVGNAQATATQIPPTLTQAAVVQEIVVDFSNVMFQIDNPDTQIAQINEIVEKYPNQATAYEARGAFYDKRGDIDLAIKDYTQALVLDPKNSDVYTLRGNLLGDQGDIEGALADYTKAIEVNPKNSNAYFNRGTTHFSNGDSDEAFADFNQAIMIDPQIALYYYIRGNAYTENEDFEEAIADYDQAIKLDPTNAEMYSARGTVHGNTGQFEEAIADYDQAIKLDPTDALAYCFRGIIRFQMEDFKAMLADCDQSIKLDPTNAFAFYYRAVSRYKLGDPKSAIEDLTQTIKLDPEYTSAYVTRGDLYFELYRNETDDTIGMGYLKQAVEDYRNAQRLGYEIAPDDEETLQLAESLLMTPTPTPSS